MDQLAGALIADLVPSQVVVRQRGVVRKELPDGLKHLWRVGELVVEEVELTGRG